MNNSEVLSFSCAVSQIGISPKDTWTISIIGDELRLKCERTQREIIIDRRNSEHRMTFPIFTSQADIILEDSSGEQWLFTSKISHTERIERWWSWPKQQSSQECSLAPTTGAEVKQRVLTPNVLETTSKPKQGLAITSLVCGIIAAWASILSIPAVICGHMALNMINKDARGYGGKGMAISGLILGYIALVLAIALGTMKGLLRVQLQHMGY